MTWETEEDVRTRGYQYVYDGQGRLTDAFYGEGSGLSVNAGRYDMHASYDAMGNPLWLSRKGKLDNGSYGYIDRVRMEYDGNHLVNATDSVSPGPTWQGVFHFADGAEAEAGVDEYEYDTNGSLTKDLNRNIFLIQYNSLNLPKKITFADNMGDISYTYSATGEKLSVGYLYGAGPIIGPILPSTASVGEGDTPQDISSGQTPRDGGGLINMDDLYSINYCGNVVYDHGVVRLLTDEGYVTFSTDGTPTYHFYVRDHLGNVRVVFDEDWDTEQVTHYYPFGGIMAESSGQSVQPWKYGGKELDRTHGLDAYDFGARTYFADRMQWGQMDPLCEKYYGISPYSYCGNNPVRFIDPIGMEPVYNMRGEFLGTTSEGFTGDVMIYSGFIKIKFETYTRDVLEEKMSDFFKTYDTVNGSNRDGLSNDTKSKIWTNLVSHFEGTQIYDEKFSMSKITGNSIQFHYIERTSWWTNPRTWEINGCDGYNYETTVENLASSIIVHEWYSHAQKKTNDILKSHRLAYKNVINYKSFWDKTTDKYKQFCLEMLRDYTKIETGRTQVDRLYRNLFKRYVK